MADVNISVSDSLRVSIGKYVKLLKSDGIETILTADTGLGLLLNDGITNERIPVPDDLLDLLREGGVPASIDVTNSEIFKVSNLILTSDYLELALIEQTSIKVLITTSDTLDLIIIDQPEAGSKPFITGGIEAWSFKKAKDSWKLDKYNNSWQSVAENYEWLFNAKGDHWKSKEELTDWIAKKENEYWKDKTKPDIWILKKRDDKWQK